ATTPETLFDVGSIGKVFTRVAIQKLREQGRLQLSDRLVRFFPEVPQDKAAITVSQLLDMRSGLHEYHDRSGDFEPMTREQALERIWKQPLRFQPGRGKGYSNSGYAVLAAIIEETSGLSYPAFLDRYLLEPAGLRRTGFYQLRQWEPDSMAVGYEALTYGEVNSPAYWPEISWACMGGGCLVSSTRELFKWFRGLAEGKILSSQSLQEVFPKTGDTQIYTGLNDFGFGALIAFEPVREDLVVVLLNSAGEEGWSPIGFDLMKLLKRLR
ncbi:MAG TPA: serine hydrolase domain-containing protein, partial [Acidobacteriota bacterium]|nr:serine hydrolase domain-containing protein [Acidobacteriota bacterium]